MTDKAKIINPKNTLKQKVGSGGFKPEDIEEAQKAIEENTIDFTDDANEFLAKLEGAIEDARKNIDDDSMLLSLTHPVMQLKAQGSMFKYPLITSISQSVLDILENSLGIDVDLLAILVQYSKSIKVILSNNIQTEQDPLGEQLAKEISAVKDRYIKKMSSE